MDANSVMGDTTLVLATVDLVSGAFVVGSLVITGISIVVLDVFMVSTVNVSGTVFMV